jgi:hypothetical protein
MKRYYYEIKTSYYEIKNSYNEVNRLQYAVKFAKIA